MFSQPSHRIGMIVTKMQMLHSRMVFEMWLHLREPKRLLVQPAVAVAGVCSNCALSKNNSFISLASCKLLQCCF